MCLIIKLGEENISFNSLVTECVFVEVSVVKTCLASLDQAGHLIAEAAIFSFHHGTSNERMRK
jgi:hypothetical protein